MEAVACTVLATIASSWWSSNPTGRPAHDVTGALALHDIGVLEARVHSEAGHALQVLSWTCRAPTPLDRVEADIIAAVEKRLSIGELLAAGRPTAPSRRLMALPAPTSGSSSTTRRPRAQPS